MDDKASAEDFFVKREGNVFVVFHGDKPIGSATNQVDAQLAALKEASRATTSAWFTHEDGSRVLTVTALKVAP